MCMVYNLGQRVRKGLWVVLGFTHNSLSAHSRPVPLGFLMEDCPRNMRASSLVVVYFVKDCFYTVVIVVSR